MRTRNVLWSTWVVRVLLGAGLAIAAYLLAGHVLGALPSNAGWRPPERGVRIFVESNGIHVGIVVPKVAAGVDWRPLLRADHLRDPRYAGFDHASFGWGDADFYLNTPTWADVSVGTVLAAAVGGERTLVHVDHVPAPRTGRDVRSLVLRPDEYRRLAAYLRDSMAAAPAHRFGYGANDVFYTARGRYSAVRTCNAWAGDALRAVGVRVGAWTPFPATVLWWFGPPHSQPNPPLISSVVEKRPPDPAFLDFARNERGKGDPGQG